jgi:hypothetical protein
VVTKARGADSPFPLRPNRSRCPVTRNTRHSITYMPSTSFNFLQVNIFCCSRRQRHESRTTLESDAASDTSTEFELVQSRSPLSKARLRWIKAILAAIIRRKVVRAWTRLGLIAKRNKAINRPDPAVSRLWGKTGHWLQRHKL